MSDRESLVLPTRVSCNKSYELIDEKIGQLIALRRGQVPSPGVPRLKFALSAQEDHGAVTNTDIEAAVWRWIAGFHAALYLEPLNTTFGLLITPFQKARDVGGQGILEPLPAQHLAFVQIIKANRAKNNLDQVQCNNQMVNYECVWFPHDNGHWMCIFAPNVCDWKDLGATNHNPARGCVGCYISSRRMPTVATQSIDPYGIVPTGDPLDPFDC